MTNTRAEGASDVRGPVEGRARRPRLWPAVVVAIVAAGVAAFLLNRGTGDDALTTVERFIDTVNSGDVDASLAYLVDEGGEFNVTTEPSTPFAQTDYDGTMRFVAWAVAGGSVWNNHTCSAAEGGESPVLVECDFQITYPLRSTMGLPDLPAFLTAAVEDGRLVAFEETFTLLPGDSASGTYLHWLAEMYPEEVDLAADVEWGTIDEAVAAGEARVRHADEWAESLGG